LRPHRAATNAAPANGDGGNDGDGENENKNKNDLDDNLNDLDDLTSRAALLRLERQRLDREEAALRLEAAAASASRRRRKAVDDALRGIQGGESPSSPSPFPPLSTEPKIYPPRGPHSPLVTARVRRDRATRQQRVAELVLAIERGDPLRPDPRVPPEVLAAAETGLGFRGRALRSRAEAELFLRAEEKLSKGRQRENEKQALEAIRMATRDAEKAARERALEREKVERKERRRRRREQGKDSSDDDNEEEEEEEEERPLSTLPLSVAPLEGREVVPAPAFPPAVERAFARSRRAALLVRRAGVLREPRALARRLVDAGLVAGGEKGDDGDDDDDENDEFRPSTSSLLYWRDDLAAGSGVSSWLSLWDSYSDAGCTLDVEGMWVHSTSCREAEREERREVEEKFRLALAEREEAEAKQGEGKGDEKEGKAPPPPPPPPPPLPLVFPQPSRLLERFVPTYAVCADCWLTVPLSAKTVLNLRRWRAFCSPAATPRRRSAALGLCSFSSLSFDSPLRRPSSSAPPRVPRARREEDGDDSDEEEREEEKRSENGAASLLRLASFVSDPLRRPPPLTWARKKLREENLKRARMLPGLRAVKKAAAAAVAAAEREGKEVEVIEKTKFRFLRGGGGSGTSLSSEIAATAAAATSAAEPRAWSVVRPPPRGRDPAAVVAVIGGGEEEGGERERNGDSLLAPRPLFSEEREQARASLSSDLVFPSLGLRFVVWGCQSPAEEEEQEEKGEEEEETIPLHPLEYFGHSRPATVTKTTTAETTKTTTEAEQLPAFDALSVLFSLQGREGSKGPLPLKKWAHRPMSERKRRVRERRAREKAHQRRMRRREEGGGGGEIVDDESESEEEEEEEEEQLAPPFDPETALFASPDADRERRTSVESGEALTIAMHLVLEFDGGGVFGGGGGKVEGEGEEGKVEEKEEGELDLLPPPIKICSASSRWLATVSAYPLSGAEVGDLVREAVGLVHGGGGGRGEGGGSAAAAAAAADEDEEEESAATATAATARTKKPKDLARRLALSGASLPRRPGEGLSI